MPTYTYHRSNCGYEHEIIKSYSDPPIPEDPECPKCKLGHLIRVWQPTAFVLKGDGWYNTDKKTKG